MLKTGTRIFPVAAGAALVLAVAALAAACSSNSNKQPTTAPKPAGTVAQVATQAGATTVASAGTPAQSTQFAPLGGNVDGIPCETSEQLKYHVHAHLTIIANGQPVVVPANTGILINHLPGPCIYWLHTHDTTGIIHIEAPSEREFQLGNFFDIWQQPLSATQVGSFMADGSHQLQFWVDGKQYTGDPRAIPLKNHTDITIVYGPPFPTPQPFNFQQAGY
jgi:hypothetical protein